MPLLGVNRCKNLEFPIHPFMLVRYSCLSFQESITKHFPYTTVSLGWASSYNSTSSATYTQSMVEEATQYAKQWELPVTLAVHAGMARDSWALFQDALSISRGFTVTLWCEEEEEEIDTSDLMYIRDHSEKSKVFYQIKDSTRNGLS